MQKKWYAGEGPNENAQHDFNESEIKNIQGRHFAISDILQPYCRGSDWRKLEKVNERGLRAVFCDWRSPYDELLTSARMASLYNRRLQDIAIPCTKYVKVKFKYLFSVSLSSYNLRNTNFFIPRFYTVKYGKHSIRNLGQFLWSKLAKTCAKQRKQVSLDVIHVSVLQPIMGKDKSQPA